MRQLSPHTIFQVSATVLLAVFLYFVWPHTRLNAEEQAPIRYVLKQTPPPTPPKSQPPKSLPRVPFSAFRMKPILDPQLEQKTDKKTVNSTPVPTPAPAAAASPVPIPPRLPARVTEAPTTTKAQDVLEVPPKTAEQKIQKSLGRLPVPPRTPARVADLPTQELEAPTAIIEADAPPVLDVDPNGPLTPPITADAPRQSELPAPMPDLLEVTNVGELPLPPEKPARPENDEAREEAAPQKEDTTLLGRLLPQSSSRDTTDNDRNRFGKPTHSSTRAIEPSITSSGSGGKIPPEAEDIKVGRLEEADGISPIKIPGIAEEAPSAPDAAKTTDEGMPSEVIVFFKENSADLEVGQMDVLINDVIKPLRERSRLKLDITAYAEGAEQQADNARRMSLSRALMIREFLIDQRISANRINVTAKGNDTDIDPRDRAELYFSR